jgi:hypothetical protein
VKKREILRLGVVWSLRVATVIVLLAMLWPAEPQAPVQPGAPRVMTEHSETAEKAVGWSLFALGQGDSVELKGNPVAMAQQAGTEGESQASKMVAPQLPPWAWGVDWKNGAAVYERWVGFAATQGTDNYAVYSLVDVVKQLGWSAAEGVIKEAIRRDDWRVTSAIFASGFVGIEDVERQQLVQRVVQSTACLNAVECYFMGALNGVAPAMLTGIFASVKVDRDECGTAVRYGGMLSVARSMQKSGNGGAEQAWCKQAPEQG